MKRTKEALRCLTFVVCVFVCLFVMPGSVNFPSVLFQTQHLKQEVHVKEVKIKSEAVNHCLPRVLSPRLQALLLFDSDRL